MQDKSDICATPSGDLTVFPCLTLVLYLGRAGACGAVEECARSQHAGADVQGLGAVESHLPVLRAAHNAPGAHTDTGRSTQCNAMQCNAMQCNAMQCNAMQCNAMQCNAMQCNAMQCNAMQCNAMQ